MSKLEAENSILRRLLWLRHGCPFPALYGDDGEMQCNVCMLDFKRDSAKRIERKFQEIGLQKYAQQIKEAKEKQKEKGG